MFLFCIFALYELNSLWAISWILSNKWWWWMMTKVMMPTCSTSSRGSCGPGSCRPGPLLERRWGRARRWPWCGASHRSPTSSRAPSLPSGNTWQRSQVNLKSETKCDPVGLTWHGHGRPHRWKEPHAGDLARTGCSACLRAGLARSPISPETDIGDELGFIFITIIPPLSHRSLLPCKILIKRYDF